MKSQPIGRLITGLAGLALIFSLFLTWYSVDVGGGAGVLSGVKLGVSTNGWESLDVGDLFLFAVGAIALAAVVLDYMGKEVELPVERVLIFQVLGGLSVAYVVLRMLDKPGPSVHVPGADFGISLGIGPFIALAGAILLLVSAFKYEGGITDGGGSYVAAPPAPATAPPVQPAASSPEPPPAPPEQQPPTQ